MKNKLSVIFLFACLVLYFIYYKFNDKNIDIFCKLVGEDKNKTVDFFL